MVENITEEMGLQEKWMARAQEMTLTDLPEFIRELIEDYNHDYGTICHAIAAAGVAACWAVERTPQGGITGFQAGVITWELLRGWNKSMMGDIGTRIQKMDDLLFPQYVDNFTSIDADTWGKLQSAAKENLAKENDFVSANVLSHWRSIAAGNLPRGISVRT